MSESFQLTDRVLRAEMLLILERTGGPMLIVDDLVRKIQPLIMPVVQAGVNGDKTYGSLLAKLSKDVSQRILTDSNVTDRRIGDIVSGIAQGLVMLSHATIDVET